MLKIITVLRSGPEWLPEYVYNFKKGLDKNLTIPFEFICLSDINLNVTTMPLLPLGPSYWSKLQMFRKDLGLYGPCLYFDLDTIITGNIDSIVNKCYEHKFLMLRDPWKPEQSASGMLWWNGDYSCLWDQYCSQSEEYWMALYKEHPKFGDQGFILDRVEHKLFQEIIDEPKSITRVTKRETSTNTKIVVFAGPHRKPWLSQTHPDVIKHWL